MFSWAIIDYSNNVLSIQRASMDVPPTRKFEQWVIIRSGTKWRENLVYNNLTMDVANG